MKTVSITELKNKLSAYLALLKSGEVILVLDRNTPIARISPINDVPKSKDAARLQELERVGLVVRGTEAIGEVLNSPPIKLPKGVSAVAALLQEREHSR